MLQINEYLLIAATVFVILSFVTYLVVISAARRTPRRQPAKAPVAVAVGAAGLAETVDEAGDALHLGGEDDGDDVPLPGGVAGVAVMDDLADLDDETIAPRPKTKTDKAPLNVSTFATGFSVVALVLLTAYLGIRMLLTGHGPFSNMHEFAVSFVWGILLAYLVTLWRFKIRMLALAVLPVAGALLVYATQTDSGIAPLVPALQNNLLLTLHVGFAILSYGAACVSFGAAALYLIYPRLKLKTPRDLFDEIGYKAAVVAFPLMTIMILLGALWARTAWGSYWSWDPKEVAALVTWLFYAAYLHARVVFGWRGTRSSVLLIVGFAAVMFAYFGNYFLGGLHSYK